MNGKKQNVLSARQIRRHPPKWLTTIFKLEGYDLLTDAQIQDFVRDRITEIEQQQKGYKYRKAESFIDEPNKSIVFKFFIEYVG